MVDRQHRPMGKTGSGGPASYQDANIQRREQLRRLALQTIDISKDPYFLRNHVGTYQCRLCLTYHTNQGSYLAHTQGKKHQTNLARRQAREARDAVIVPQKKQVKPKSKVIKIGRPIYRCKKQRHAETNQKQVLIEVEYPQIQPKGVPKYRFMSAFEQKIESPDKRFQFLLIAADPYITIAFKVPNEEIDMSEGKYFQVWDAERKIYILTISFKDNKKEQ